MELVAARTELVAAVTHPRRRRRRRRSAAALEQARVGDMRDDDGCGGEMRAWGAETRGQAAVTWG
jgi:hypothetical protein